MSPPPPCHTHREVGLTTLFIYQEAEKKRYKAEHQRFEMKHSKQLEESRAGSQAAIKELEQLQGEKRKLLMEHETSKLKDLDENYSKALKEWKADLKPRKQNLEDKFQAQLEEQERHYGHYLTAALQVRLSYDCIILFHS